MTEGTVVEQLESPLEPPEIEGLVTELEPLEFKDGQTVVQSNIGTLVAYSESITYDVKLKRDIEGVDIGLSEVSTGDLLLNIE